MSAGDNMEKMPVVASSLAALSAVAKMERLSAAVYRVLGCNAGPLTLQGTNTYLVGTGHRRLLIDTGSPGYGEYTANVKRVLCDERCAIGSIVCTHWHVDHVGGVGDVLRSCCPPRADNNGDEVKIYKLPRAGGATDAPLPDGLRYTYVRPDSELRVDGATLRLLHTPGHTDDHMSLLLEEEQAVFTGDCILGEGTAVFDDLHDYMRSLHTLLQLRPRTLYPGHGPVIKDGCAKIAAYISHRNAREEQIVAAMRDEIGATAQPISASRIVDIVYTDTRAELKPAALVNVRNHLGKLRKEHRVELVSEPDDTWRLLDGGAPAPATLHRGSL